MSSIRLHHKHGLNPSCAVCFFCREPKEVVLFGASGSRLFPKRGGEAPREVLIDYEPCLKCAERFKEGILLVEATRHPTAPGQPAIKNRGEDIFPTGSFALIRREAAERIFNVPIPDGKAFVEPGILEAIGALPAKEG